METRSKSSRKNAQKRRARQRHRDDQAKTLARIDAAKKIQFQVRFNSLCAKYLWMTPEKNRLLDKCLLHVKGVIHGWTKEELSIYFYMYRIVGTMNNVLTSTSTVVYFFTREHQHYVLTQSGNFYILKDEELSSVQNHKCIAFEKRLEAIEIRARILSRV